MSKINKIYKKAMNNYCEGKLDKALVYCDKVLEVERGHAPTLNLKGLIFYIRGELEQAKFFWKLGYKLNGDMVSKKYLEDVRKDENDYFIYNQGVLLFNGMKVRESLNCFLKCEGSHFNCINLWTYMSKCYMQLGEYEKSIKYVQEAIKTDCKNAEAIKIENQLVELGIMEKRKKSKTKPVIITAGVVAALMIIFGVYKSVGYITAYKANKEAEKLNSISENKEIPAETEKPAIQEESKTEPEEEQSKPEEVQVATETFDAEKLKEYINNEEYENIIEYIEKFDGQSLGTNDKSVIESGKTLVLDKGVEKLYNDGSSYIESKDYNSAISKLSLAYKYSSGSYLNEHIVFMLASCYDNLGDVETSNKYYESYVDSYLKEGSYIEQCLYSLVVNNKGIDSDKSKKYAQILYDNYRQSDFNNSIVKEVLGN